MIVVVVRELCVVAVLFSIVVAVAVGMVTVVVKLSGDVMVCVGVWRRGTERRNSTISRWKKGEGRGGLKAWRRGDGGPEGGMIKMKNRNRQMEDKEQDKRKISIKRKRRKA